ncbi:MAG: hypothetical protein HKN47_23205 [Pirellulaceae bacterium]|nr:hypothetical protein [Pirellulaceae bacterium]
MQVIKPFFATMFALFVGAGATGLIVQMWSPWALSHFRSLDQPLPKLGTRALFELTTITAVSYAIIIALSNDPALTTNNFIFGTTLLSVFGIVASLAGICLIQMFLRDRRGRPISVFIPLTLLLGTSLILPTFVAVQEFGWNTIRRDAPIVIVAAAYGMLLICAVIALHLGWLYACGWRCLNRRSDA